jgi:hypothetical protein
MSRVTVRQGSSFSADEEQAVGELVAQIGGAGLSVVILFCSPRYDLARLGPAIAEQFDCPVIGCTTAGEIASTLGYRDSGIVGVSIASDEMVVHPKLIHPLKAFDARASVDFAAALQRELTMSPSFDPARMFGFLLVDGLSMLEEQVTASLFNNMDGVRLFGGSAGDNLDFGTTYVYHDGHFHTDAALFTLFETTLPFRIFRIQHFEPTETRLVITEADGARRLVSEINGEPAAQEYARAVGLEIGDLTPQVFAAYPVMLKINGEYFVRSIQKVNDDGSLTFYCAIDNGLVLTVARGTNLVEHLKQNLRRLADEVPNLQLLLGCDCILRRLELAQTGQTELALPVLAACNFIGFSTYGEQFNGIHVNQTLTGLALGC